VQLDIFLPTFNTPCIRLKIRYDRESYKIFGSLRDLNTALLTLRHRSRFSLPIYIMHYSVLILDLGLPLHELLEIEGPSAAYSRATAGGGTVSLLVKPSDRTKA
jgi:hypothetical protein